MGMTRDQVTTLSEVIGGVLLTIGAGLFAIPAGLIVAGACFIVLGWANS
jgi:hypothetical protein